MRARLAIVSAAIFAIAGGIAYAAIPDSGTGTYHACMLKSIGTIRIIDPDKQHCIASLETEITFNQQGPKGDPGTNGVNGSNGSNGVSPTVAQLAPGSANCVAGGAAITDAAGSTAYVCNGTNGHDGADGQPFSGTFTSPNGNYSISVTDTGVRIAAANGAQILFTDGDITVRARGATTVMGDTSITVRAGSDLDLRAQGNATLRGGAAATVQAAGQLGLSGSTVAVNGGGTCAPAARLGDAVGGSSIVGGSPTVCIG